MAKEEKKSGLFSSLLKGGAHPSERTKEEKEKFLDDVKEEIESKEKQDKIDYVIGLLQDEDNDDVKKELRAILFEAFPESANVDYKIIYDSFSEGLEPVYFWAIDFMKDTLKFDVKKTKEDFYASVGSAFFGEMGGRATKMQEQAIKMLGTINTVIRSIINLVYDLKEFDIRLDNYRILESEKSTPEQKQAAELGLKQVWMDQVDIKKGLGAINNMTQQLQFVTLRDAYMQANSLEDVDKMDLNDRVKRILKMKIDEYIKWKEYSKKELTARYNIERAYLKSQVASLKLYSEWTKPYLLAAKKLDMKIGDLSRANIVSVFNNMDIELQLAGKKELKVESMINDKDLPEDAKVNDKYFQYVVVSFNFRSVPHSVQTPQGYQYRQGGRVEVTFKGYGFSEEELDIIKKSDEEEAFKLIDEMVGTTLDAISDDLDKYSIEDKRKPEKAESEAANEEGPIGALASGFKTIFRPLKDFDILPKAKFFDDFVRNKAKSKAAETSFTVYDVYKKAHGMMSF